jgi:DNA-binding response OmpR family regulator
LVACLADCQQRIRGTSGETGLSLRPVFFSRSIAMTEANTQVEMMSPANQLGMDLDEAQSANHYRVLIVEDDGDTVFLLKQILQRAGFNVMSAHNGQEALHKCADLRPDLVLLDIMMPEVDGWDTLKYLRQVSNIPVIMISALSSKEDVVKALHSGVDDYITKPFFNDEVVARIMAVLRRASTPKMITKLAFPKVALTIDLDTREVTCHNQLIQLTAKEFEVLSVLAQHAPSIVSYPVMARTVWGEDVPEVRKRTKYLIYLLRRKFAVVEMDKPLLVNVGRLGYKLNTDG